MYCICCKKNNVVPMEGLRGRGVVDAITDEKLTEEDMLWHKEKSKDGIYRNINNEMVDGGIIHIIEAGYGSKHDGDQIILAICDDCIKENLQDGTVLYFDNYMPGYRDLIEKDIENSKKIYRRRKNLDGLV